MNLLGLKVKHNVFGDGVVIEKVDSYITVEFVEKTAKFAYPDVFEKFLKAEDVDVQTNIIKEIEMIKVETEQKRKAEEANKASEKIRTVSTYGVALKTKRTKSIDDMFAKDYHVENLARQHIFTYQQVEEQFGIRISGFGRGINPTENTVVLISSIGKAGGNFVYHDKWTKDGDYIYSGEGKRGDQKMNRGNLAIRDAARDGKEIHLFIKFSPKDYYYQAVFELADYSYEDDKDKDGNIRKEYKFRLKKVNVEQK
ncbi:MAG: hypothetical protein GX337_08515 [Christensenellaceae bacterium]|nr:hypothetical protein [Christensenellaceae bacterium]